MQNIVCKVKVDVTENVPTEDSGCDVPISEDLICERKERNSEYQNQYR